MPHGPVHANALICLWRRVGGLGRIPVVSPLVRPANSVILVAGRESYTPPESLNGQPCAATADCIAIGVVSADDDATDVSFSPDGAAEVPLGDFQIDTDGQLSVRDIYGEVFDVAEVKAPRVRVTVAGNDGSEPTCIRLGVLPAG